MARMVMCKKLGKELPGLTFKPFPNELGQRIYDSISQDALEALARALQDDHERVPALGGRSADERDPVPAGGAVLLQRRRAAPARLPPAAHEGLAPRQGRGERGWAQGEQALSDAHPGDILLVSTYELGHAPHGLALPKAFLERAGFAPAALDLAVERLDPERVRRARLVALSVPMHTALRLELEAASRIRALAPDALLCFHGLYAPLNADLLVSAGAAAVLGGECEEALVALARAIERGDPLRERFIERGGAAATSAAARLPRPEPRGAPRPSSATRGSSPATARPRRRLRRGEPRLQAPLPPLPDPRRVRRRPLLRGAGRDRRRGRGARYAAGAEHVTFGDPDFLNGPRTRSGSRARSTPGSRRSRSTSPRRSSTSCVRRARCASSPASGALFVTSAVESLSDRVLAKLAKGHTRADALAAFDLAAEAGIALRPSLLPFTPWSTLDDYLELLEALEARGWLSHLDPVQLSIRLLVPPGSLLEDDPEIAFDGRDPAALSWRWRHPDARMDALQARVAAEVEAGAAANEAPLATIARVKALALAAAGRRTATSACSRRTSAASRGSRNLVLLSGTNCGPVGSARVTPRRSPARPRRVARGATLWLSSPRPTPRDEHPLGPDGADVTPTSP